MTKYFFILCFGVSLLLFQIIEAQSVSIEEAQQVSISKIYNLGQTEKFKLESSPDLFHFNDNQPLFYVNHLSPVGYIVVIADKNLPPVIAYSFTSEFFGMFR